MSEAPARVGVIGCGDISGIYLKAGQVFTAIEIVACADLDMAKARARADEYHVPVVCTVEELLADPTIEIVLNLTAPAAHAAIGLSALEAGKNVYNEKPLALNRGDARRMLELARVRSLRLGCAPDTFLGGGLQTCRKLIDDGWIGVPIGASASFMGHGPESWHPDPDFFYQTGAGPLFDMGPYYLTALTALLGPMRRVTGSARISFPERVITSQPLFGNIIKVTTPTHVVSVIDFVAGPIATLTASFDVWSAETPRLEIYGTEGSLSVPDPNTFGGPVRVRRAGASEWSALPLTHGYAENSRGLGLADMAHALRSGRPHRASGELGNHVLDAMHAILDASSEGTHIDLNSSCARPAPLPMGLPQGTLDS